MIRSLIQKSLSINEAIIEYCQASWHVLRLKSQLIIDLVTIGQAHPVAVKI